MYAWDTILMINWYIVSVYCKHDLVRLPFFIHHASQEKPVLFPVFVKLYMTTRQKIFSEKLTILMF